MGFSLQLREDPTGEIEAARRGDGRDPRARRAPRSQPDAALRRPAPAGRARSRDHPRAGRVPPRRAALEPRRPAPRPDTRRDRRIQRRLATTTIFVTHDQIEAMTLADRSRCMRKGVVQQVAPPRSSTRTRQHVRRRLHRLAGDELRPGRSATATCGCHGGVRPARIARARPPGPRDITSSRGSGPSTSRTSPGRATDGPTARGSGRVVDRFDARDPSCLRPLAASKEARKTVLVRDVDVAEELRDAGVRRNTRS